MPALYHLAVFDHSLRDTRFRRLEDGLVLQHRRDAARRFGADRTQRHVEEPGGNASRRKRLSSARTLTASMTRSTHLSAWMPIVKCADDELVVIASCGKPRGM